MGNGVTVTISAEEYRMLKKIADAANFAIGFIVGAAAADKTKGDLKDTLECVRGRLERAVES